MSKALLISIDKHKLVMPYNGNLTAKKYKRAAAALIEFLVLKGIKYNKGNNLEEQALNYVKHSSIKLDNFHYEDKQTYINIKYNYGAMVGLDKADIMEVNL